MRSLAIAISKFSDLLLNLGLVIYSIWVLPAWFGGSAWHKTFLENLGMEKFEKFLHIGEYVLILIFIASVLCAILSDSLLTPKTQHKEKMEKELLPPSSSPAVNARCRPDSHKPNLRTTRSLVSRHKIRHSIRNKKTLRPF